MTIDEILDKEGFSECEAIDCPYYHAHSNRHPYGESTASELMECCDASCDEDCPRL